MLMMALIKMPQLLSDLPELKTKRLFKLPLIVKGQKMNLPGYGIFCNLMLRYVVKEFLEYYNHERPHSALDGKMIDPWPQDADGEIVEFTRLGGLLKSYRRVKMAA